MLHQIGSGVLGPVFRAVDRDADRLLALKVFRLDLLPEDLARFAHGLRRLAARGRPDPALVLPIDGGFDAGSPFAALPLIAGESLEARRRQAATVSVAEAGRLLEPVARALDRAADHGLVHGALHPRDILVRTQPFEVHVTGVGIAGLLEPLGIRVPVRRPYAPPERLQGQTVSGRTDVYALAAIAHELLDADSRAAQRDVFARALADDPEQRFESALAFVSALDGKSRQISVAAPRRPTPEVASLVTPVAPLPAATDLRPVAPPAATDELIAAPLPVAAPPTAVATAPSPRPSSSSVPRDVLLRLQAESSVPQLAAPVPVRRPRRWIGPTIVAAGLMIGAVGGLTISQRWGAAAVPPVASPAPVTETEVPIASSDAAASAIVLPPAASPVRRVSAPTSRLVVRSSPAGALVTIDGRLIGETPLTVRDLRPGEYQVRIARPGYAPYAERVALPAGARPHTVSAVLQKGFDITRPYGGLQIDSLPRGAHVTVDGKYLGRTPLRWPEAAPGAHLVELSLPGYAPTSSRVTVAPGDLAKLTLTLHAR